MSNYNKLFRQLRVDKKMVADFFIIFSRFEYTLKRAGFATGDDGKVSANWGRFASVLKEHFDSTRTPELQEAVRYLDSHPPKKQILDNGVLSWRDSVRNNDPQLIWLVRLIRTVRNNMFHGGKFPHFPVQDPSRNERLLHSSLVVQYECIELADAHCPDVQQFFYDYIGVICADDARGG